MKKGLLLICLLSLLTGHGLAQYMMSGHIEYERKTNLYAQMKEDEDDNDVGNSFSETIKAHTPKFRTSYFDLTFDAGRSVYKPGREAPNQQKSPFFSEPASDNIVFTDYRSEKVKAVKNVYEQKFIVRDSVRRLRWKAKDELRVIAGYKCRKAVGVICDSVYVVAFYTEDIPCSGGPEMFGGLPGMILELAIPRLHTTWVADKIEALTPKEEDFKTPDKGKEVNGKTLYETLLASLKDWGRWASKNIWWSVI